MQAALTKAQARQEKPNEVRFKLFLTFQYYRIYRIFWDFDN